MTGDHPNGSTSTSLVRRAQQADSAAWEKLTRLYGPVVYGWARKAGLQPDDAADVMQNVFHALTTKLGQFHRRSNGDSFRGWLFAITRNKIKDHFRGRRAKAEALGGTDAQQMWQRIPEKLPDAGSEQGRAEVSGIRRRALELASGDFEGRTWRIFWRTTVEGDAAADVATDFGISVWAVYKARSRVLTRLRAEFRDLLD